MNVPKNIWVHSLVIPPGAALLGACVRHFGEISRKLNDPPVPGLETTQAIIIFGGLAAGWGCLAFHRFPSNALKWLALAGYPIPMLLVSAIVNALVNGIGIEGF
jgi:hypothetical protein